MSGNNDESRKYFGGFLDETVHKAMVDVCSLIGKRPIDFAELCVIEGIKREYSKFRANDVEMTPGVLLAIRQMELGERRNNRMIVQQMALECLEAPSEEMLEKLSEACQMIGSSVEDELERAQKNAHILKLVEDGGGKLGKAEMWLADHMQPQVAYDSKSLLQEAQAQGFSEATINRAKAKMPIRSDKVGKKWTWTLNIGSENQADAPPPF